MNQVLSAHRRTMCRAYRRSRFVCALAATAIALNVIPAVAQAQGSGADRVVAEINGQPVTYADVAAFQQALPQARDLPTDQILSQLLELYVDTQVVVAQAKAKGYDDDPQVVENLARLKDELLRQAYLRDRIKEKVDEDTLLARYEAQVASMPDEEEIRARHILVADKAKAESIIGDLRDGADFVELATSQSEGPSAPDGGDLGYFTADMMVPEFSEAAFAIEPGDFSQEPVRSSFGWHVIKVEDKRMRPKPTFEELRSSLLDEMSGEIVTEVISELRSAADVKIMPQAAPQRAP